MAKNDFFVIACRILSYLYACMKEGEKPDEDRISPEGLGINQRYWTSIMLNIHEKGYIRGVIPHTFAGERAVALESPEITMDGIQFLEENTAIARAKAFLKELKEIIPGI